MSTVVRSAYRYLWPKGELQNITMTWIMPDNEAPKSILLGSLGIFLIGSVLSGVSKDMIMLIISRKSIMTQSIFTYSSTSKFNNLTHRCYRWYRWRGDSDDCQHCYFGRRLPSRPWKISRNHRRCCRHRKCSWPIDRRIILQRWALEMVFCMSPFK